MIHGKSVLGHMYCLFRGVDTAMWTSATSEDVKVTSVPLLSHIILSDTDTK